jgi:hypothetical protein
LGRQEKRAGAIYGKREGHSGPELRNDCRIIGENQNMAETSCVSGHSYLISLQEVFFIRFLFRQQHSFSADS